MLIDSHVNLHGEAFATDLADVLMRASAAGIGGCLAICDRFDNFPSVLAIAGMVPDDRSPDRRIPEIWASVGAHPHLAKDHPDLSTDALVQAAANDRVIAIGETGLDQHYGYSPLPDQIALFAAHLRAAQMTGLPVIIHTREADQLTADMLEAAFAENPFPILLHCYTGGADLAARALALGGYVSFSGIATFRNAHDVRAIAEMVPLERMLIETDCPYLAPVPFRGRRCEPAHLVHSAEFLAGLRGVEPAQFAEITTDNFFRLFSRARMPEMPS